jgi:hypothetical protein
VATVIIYEIAEVEAMAIKFKMENCTIQIFVKNDQIQQPVIL